MVISSISVEDRNIKLNQASFGVPNIFDIESVSLVIGNNGAGKTYFLNRILDKFTPKAKDDRFSCEIYLDSGRRMNFQDMRGKWGAVYYSPIPYGGRLHSSKNLIDASPNWSRPLSIFDLKAHDDILREFNISPKVYASKALDIRKICRVIVDVLVIQPFPEVKIEVLMEASKRLIKFLVDSNKSKRGRETSAQMEWEKTEKKLIDEAAAAIYHILMDVISDDLESFCFFAVLEHYIGRGKKVAEIVDAMVREVLDRKYPQIKYEPLEVVSKVFDEIHRAISFISRHRFEIKMGSRSTMEAELDPFEKSPLTEWGVEHLFEAGFQNMSSGQLAILAQLSLISDAVKTFSDRKIKRVLLLVDEGDAFLHLEWQRKYIGHLNRMLARLKEEHDMISIQLILATHSPLLATDVPKEFVFRMEAKDNDGAPSAFAAPLHELLNQSFGAKTIGEFASEKINEVVRNYSEGKNSDKDDFIVSSIDNPIIKAEVLRRTRGEGYRG